MTRAIHIRILSGLLCLIITSSGSVHAQTADEVLAALRSKYDTMTSLRATFNQTTSSTYMDETEHFHGDIILQGDSYRIEMPSQTIVTDTRITWVYNKSENQVLINDYVDDETTFSLSRFLNEFDSAYTVDAFESTDEGSILTLLPLDPFSSFQSVTIWTRSRDDLVTRLDVVDVNDVQMSLDLLDIEFNPPVPGGSFVFVTPEGVEEIDLRDN